MRKAVCERKTNETDIRVELNLDGTGKYCLKSGISFFDHMLSMLARHGLIDLSVSCEGDLAVDAHHSVEDMGIALGRALGEALGEKVGIARYATCFLPMDEALAMVSVDLSGRPFLVYDVQFQTEKTGDFDACLMEEFLRSFAFAAGVTLHVKLLYGKNTHHILEAIAKGLARALRTAVSLDPRETGVPSTKGVL